ncbi:MAG TPA: WD40 repeat domain-containing protein [Verrucomicrobiota bacterium]|nr:WD40 repeat domain-containing protein [Verrucomicrobiota bacterium]
MTATCVFDADAVMKGFAWVVIALLISTTAAAAEGGLATELVAQFECGDVEALAVSPDGSTLVTCGNSGVFLWELPSGAYVRSFEGHTDWVFAVAVSLDGKRLVTGSGDETARLWELATGRLLRSFAHDDWVEAVAISPDGSRIVTGVGDTARLWNASTGNLIRTFTGHLGSVESVAFSPDGQHVLTGSWDKTAKLWKTTSSSAIRTFVGDTSWIVSVAFSPDGSNVLTGSMDGPARLWDTSTGKLVRKYEEAEPWPGRRGGGRALFSPKGDRVLCVGYTDYDGASLWATSGEFLCWFCEDEQCWASSSGSGSFLPNGRQILTARSSSVALWNLSDLNPRLSIGLTNGLPAIRWSDATATLQKADSLNGAWTDLPSIGSPYRITSPARMQLFRLKLE